MKDNTHTPNVPELGARPSEVAARAEGLVGRLLALADAGPEIPADGADRVRAAIRPAWRREVRARSRRRRLVWGAASLAAAAAAVLAVALATLLLRSEPVAAPPGARLALAIGALEVTSPTGATVRLGSADAGASVAPGSRLRTGSSSRASLELEGGQSLRIDGLSDLTLDSATSVALQQGGVYVDSDGDRGRGVEVRTTFGVAREIGTQFEVRREHDSLTVRVREGRVELRRDAESLEISQGTALTVAADGSRSTHVSSPYGAEWDWVQQVAPAFELEGRTVVELLDWVSRETGLWISFADPEVEEIARTTILHGDLSGVSPGQAPELVLPSCGLEAGRRTGSLSVGRLTGGP